MSAGELVRAAIESLNSDIDYFYEQLSDDVTFAPFGVVGPAACRRIDQPFYDAFSDHQRTVERLIEDGDKVYTWTRFSGTTLDGTAVELQANGHYIVRDNKIVAMSLFTDTAALAKHFTP